MLYSPVPMHIPDNFLSIAVSLICWAITAVTLGIAISRTNKSLGEKQVPLMGVMAAFIFAAQMINFPVLGGTSGHLLGGVLAAITLGPWAGMLVMTAVIAVQGLLFQDGGLIVMGANILNMGILTCAVGYGLYRSVLGSNRTVKLAVIGVAAWLSVMTGALSTALQIWLSGNAEVQIIVPAMLFVHAFIGLGEALITVAAIVFILRSRPDLLGEGSESAQGSKGWILTGVLITLAVVLLSPFASASPDGLERVAEDLGFINIAQSAPYEVIPDYTIPFLGATPISTIVAGAIGVIVVLAIAFIAGRSLQTKKPNS
ncbi:energy-coupling factor ABC transporter permease [Candidatus Villigracilis saccharophilus]|uniref:energy-coupling factor ABC transporter permease n=1 Tax=Candidatus Villigracilis saccharophilus TaxID=3140684 RepID=UPI0031375EDB|nr:energy-coupling factor ABC transporter permease [Anaerolineales bacterium]